MALHGAHVTDVSVNLLISERDAPAFLQNVGASWKEGQLRSLFHCLVFGIWDKPPVPIEAFGGFDRRRMGVGAKLLSLHAKPSK